MPLHDSPEQLAAVTRVLQRRRRADATGPVWEAADVQWWSTRRPVHAQVWGDAAAVVVTDWAPDRHGCDVLADADFGPAWTLAAKVVADTPGRVEMAVSERDLAAQAAARRIGLAPIDETWAVCWLDPAGRIPPRRPLPVGFRIVSRAEDGHRPHPMIARNGASIAERLRRCSLYAADLDLAVLAPDGTVAGYALFWPDPVTGVGLVEPMRVEDGHAGQGLGAHLLDAGLRGLTEHRCTRLKVSFVPANTAAGRLYTGAGFVVSGHDRTWAT